ncbi:leader peptidase (prepilin peptidase)/N-methyltransferase [Inhella inkyongensis]|uniref:Prepilin leader peptidase/N-methyltransferase n=1 Tax=Inhella inkyongensis TaxID=392593 RepID=A0A840S1N1_9BURK|nr:A24 family peptidase [Inhella inkyongensis]MBB5203328.1 leader peptidase (prepilin peptidase)/N-methyltransferase [Inhella inkyongensis]
MPAIDNVWFSWWALGILGLCIGSFLNVVAHRFPRILERRWLMDAAYQLGDSEGLRRATGWGEAQAKAWESHSLQLGQALEAQPPLGLAKPRSRCPQCGHSIAWHENLPVLGWLRLRGRCAACKSPISPRYPLVELATGLLFSLIGWRFGPQPLSLLWCGFAALLLAASLIDWDTTLLPDDLTLPLLWAGLAAAWMGWTLPLNEAVLGAIVGYLSLWSVYWLFKLTTGKEGMGYGDFKLLAALGAWLGATMILPIVLAASAIGALVGIVMKMTGSLREGRFVPFGPFLAGAGLVVLLAGAPRVLGWLGWA